MILDSLGYGLNFLLQIIMILYIILLYTLKLLNCYNIYIMLILFLLLLHILLKINHKVQFNNMIFPLLKINVQYINYQIFLFFQIISLLLMLYLNLLILQKDLLFLANDNHL
jgi:hypothetical protein